MNEETPTRIDGQDRHLSETEMAKLIEGSLASAGSEALFKHLRSCHRCREILKDACLSHSLWEINPDIIAPDPDLVDAGMQIALQESITAGNPIRTFLASIRNIFTGRRPYIPIAAALIVVALTLVWFHDDQTISEHQLPSSTVRPIQQAIETVSRWGPLVLPGGEGAVGKTGIRLRSGYVHINESLESSLNDLYDMYRRGNMSPDVVYYLTAGYVATGQIDMARDLTTDARNRRFTDARTLSIEALIAFIDGDLETAERILRENIISDPDDLVAATNLAIVFREQGRYDEAAQILTRIRNDHPGSTLAVRAEILLGTFPRR